MNPTITLSWPEPHVALLTLDMPDKGANILSSAVVAELRERLDEVAAHSDTLGVVLISGKPGMFIAGADLGEFIAGLDAPPDQTIAKSQAGQQLFRRLAELPFVTVAAIDGICVGGGAELAMWCDRRVLSNDAKTSYGFPEVKLGLLPGWGGTARLPRMIGLSNAVEMITGGENIDPQEAWALGVADDVTSADTLLSAAIRLVHREAESKAYQRDRETWAAPIVMSPNELGFLGAAASAVILGQTKGRFPAPMAALELMLESQAQPLDNALRMESEAFARLFGTEVNRALLNIYFLTDRNKRDRGVDTDVRGADVTSVGVVGAGIMGGGIAAANLKRGLPTVLTDASADALRSGAEAVMKDAAYDRKTKAVNAENAMRVGALLNLGSMQHVAGCDVVVEAIVENMDIKRKVLQALESEMRPDAVLGSNTSTIPITKLADGLARPEQFCGIHFFNPVRRMKLVEVIRGESTTDETVATAVGYAKRVGKMPIVVHDGPGFLVNRLLFPYMNESLQLLMEGADIGEIEKASTRFGMPMGPLALYDMVGLDTALYAGRVMWEAFPERIHALPILPALVKQGRLGQKSGSGFFNYANRKGKAESDPYIDEFLTGYVKERRAHDRETLTWRLFAPMILEATRVLEEKLVRDVRDVDLGMVFGLGFPAFRGGLLCWADTIGAAEIVERLKPLAELGSRFEPTPLLLEMARRKHSFYGSH
ncbi:MAG: enoyl-CoA hydratase/isomerase family protein [Planctomycetales bacterium]|nr:enoyl-CoA hydratase/isomerase family protein [Planctomycetales bacterium]